MATPQQRSWCVLQLGKKDSVTAVQCAFRTQFHMEPPNRASRLLVAAAIHDLLPTQPTEINAPRSPDLTPCDFFLWGYIKYKVFVPPLQRSLPDLRQRITSAIASTTRDTAQSLRRVGLSSRHLPCDSWSTDRVSVRCVQNFESFSIDWCRCEVLSTPHLFSVSFWKCKCILCSPCTSLHTLRVVKCSKELSRF
jgi:hypothetical protein